MPAQDKTASCVAAVGVGFVLFTFFGEWWIYHVVCTPELCWAMLFNPVFILAIWSYLATVLTDPGSDACTEWKKWNMWREAQNPPRLGAPAEESSGPQARGWKPGEATWCTLCGRERPERAHHCRQCGHCVLRMDHHCPWVGGCVGWRNHKYFLLMNWWSFWTCLVFLVSLRHPSTMQAIGAIDMVIEGSEYGAVLLVGVMSAGTFMFVTGGMFASSLWMASKNITIVEEAFKGDNPYRLPSSLDNLRQLFGPLDWQLFVPLPPKTPLSGTSFPLGKPRSADEEDGTGSLALKDKSVGNGTIGMTGQQAAYGSM